ncbi:MAG: helix-turn-helix transcriptional regulator [Longimicrobiales bacterium]|nr:helix-turn-helix transcriptional regulator [Longimicrobiales bacterium]
MMRFRHLDYGSDTPVSAMGAAALDDLLDRGDLEAWAPIVRLIQRDPWCPTADTVLRLCDAHSMYGTSALFRTWIHGARARRHATETTLAQARARAGLTQSQVAERLGISQSDVSKLERRADVRLSTLRAYASAIGASLHVGIQGPGDEEPKPLGLPGR